MIMRGADYAATVKAGVQVAGPIAEFSKIPLMHNIYHANSPITIAIHKVQITDKGILS
jgi:hypothetical protein